ncbi:MAG TPA: ABC transporter permease [Candidatus Tectomicrobia bacterium]|nr:ABC transporter permease [Candidatus Tectomicrobia bacterium]
MASRVASLPPHAYLGLVWTLVRTDFKSRYHGTVAGFLWALLKPLAMFVVLMTVFSFVFASEARYSLRLIIGLFLYEFFAEGTRAGLSSLLSKGYLLTKARTPSWIIVAASASNAIITTCVFAGVVVLAMTIYGTPPSPRGVALFLYYFVHYIAIVLGISLAGSALYLRYRDLNQVWEVVTQAGFFLAPVIYPLDILPERVHAYLYLWPPTPIIQFSRAVLVDGAVPTARAHLCLLAGAALILGIGIVIFRRYGRTAAEHL